ncbi:MAG: 2-hydroxyacid dehydrogenase [Clostridiaceae bacterium]
MAKKKVYVTRYFEEDSIDFLKKHFDVEVYDKDEPVPREIFLRKIGEADAVISIPGDKVDAEAMDIGKNVKIFANAAVGYDNIDVSEAAKRGVYVTNTPDVLSDTTAELAFALMLGCARRIVDADQYTRDGLFKMWSTKKFLGYDIKGKTVGIVGAGRIGKAFAKKCSGFDVKIIYHNRRRDPEFERDYKAEFASLEVLLKNSDFISIHTPLTEETYHIISDNEFAMMKKNAVIINTARGPVLDEKALVRALKAKKIYGAGLDVYEKEPSFEEELKELENVILLPHIGSGTFETRRKMAMLAAENVYEVLSGRKPITPIE